MRKFAKIRPLGAKRRVSLFWFSLLPRFHALWGCAFIDARALLGRGAVGAFQLLPVPKLAVVIHRVGLENLSKTFDIPSFQPIEHSRNASPCLAFRLENPLLPCPPLCQHRQTGAGSRLSRHAIRFPWPSSIHASTGSGRCSIFSLEGVIGLAADVHGVSGYGAIPQDGVMPKPPSVCAASGYPVAGPLLPALFNGCTANASCQTDLDPALPDLRAASRRKACHGRAGMRTAEG